MRTTLDIDDDVLAAAKEIASKERKTAGKIISEMFRHGIHAERTAGSSPDSQSEFIMKNGIPVFPSRGEVITSEHVARIMEDEGI